MHNLEKISYEWLEFHSTSIKFSTINMYKLNIKRICTYFSDYNIEDISAFEAQKFLNSLYSDGLSKSTIQKAKVTLGLIINYANHNNIINYDISKYIKTPKNASVSRRRPLTDNQVKLIYNDVNSIYDLYLLVLLLLGLRRSEAVALRWEDFNFKNNSVCICRVVNWHGNKPIIYNYLKNHDDERILPIPISLLNSLNKFRKEAGFVFNNDGKLFTASQIDRFWDTCTCNKELLDITQHMLRHTYATMLYKSGVDIKTAQYLMGHRDITMILKIYTHLDMEYTHRNIDKLNNYISNSFD